MPPGDGFLPPFKCFAPLGARSHPQGDGSEKHGGDSVPQGDAFAKTGAKHVPQGDCFMKIGDCSVPLGDDLAKTGAWNVPPGDYCVPPRAKAAENPVQSEIQPNIGKVRGNMTSTT